MTTKQEVKKIIVIGGGFAGLQFIKLLGNHNEYQIILVDTNNYNFFPPLIYQVATGFMEPSTISYPFRKILRTYTNVHFRMGILEKVVPEENKIILNNGVLQYDILVMATGTISNFFGNKNIEAKSLPMKTIGDALLLRNSFLARLEHASRKENEEERKKYLTFVIAGAGPTGVELSGVLAEMKSSVLLKDYPELKSKDAVDIYLIDGQDAVLAVMSEKAQKYATRKLTDLGVKILLKTLVNDYDGETVFLSDGTQIASKNFVWAAGVAASVFEGFSKESIGDGKRLITNQFSQVHSYENIYALGDCSIITDDKNYPKGHPQLAQVAIQQAANLAKNLKRKKENWTPFQYNDSGALAIIGRNKAVFDFSKQKYFMFGFTAWLIWAFVHILGLVNFRNRFKALYNWLGSYISKDQFFRMIIKPTDK